MKSDTCIQILLIIHIISGSMALVSGTLAIISKKGKPFHVLNGRIYFIAMLIVCLTALTLSLISHNPFLGMTAVFSLYQTVEGYKVLKNNKHLGKLTDFILFPAFALNSVWMLISGNPVLLLFAAISVFIIAGRIRTYLQISSGKKVQHSQQIQRHVGMMCGSYIAALTAFLVNVKPLQGSLLLWFIPFLSILPYMIYSILRLKQGSNI